MDLAQYRPRPPQVICSVCHKRVDSVEDTGLHLGFTKTGVVLIQIKCHGETQNIAASFKWIKDNPDYIIIAFLKSDERYGIGDDELKLLDSGTYPDVSNSIREVRALENVK